MPFWELASQLQHLRIRNIFDTGRFGADDLLPDFNQDDFDALAKSTNKAEKAKLTALIAQVDDRLRAAAEEDATASNELDSDQHPRLTGELLEQDLTAFEIPLTPNISSSASICQQHCSIAARTVVAAVRGGKLKRLHFGTALIHEPFAVRALVPLWIGIQEWEIRALDDGNLDRQDFWAQAALSLRHVLSYASRHLNGREDRLLTCDDVRALLGHSSDIVSAAWTALEEQWLSLEEDPDVEPIELYLRWFAEDAELAQQVADAWNAVVERGEADELPIIESVMG